MVEATGVLNSAGDINFGTAGTFTNLGDVTLDDFSLGASASFAGNGTLFFPSNGNRQIMQDLSGAATFGNVVIDCGGGADQIKNATDLRANTFRIVSGKWQPQNTTSLTVVDGGLYIETPTAPNLGGVASPGIIFDGVAEWSDPGTVYSAVDYRVTANGDVTLLTDNTVASLDLQGGTLDLGGKVLTVTGAVTVSTGTAVVTNGTLIIGGNTTISSGTLALDDTAGPVRVEFGNAITDTTTVTGGLSIDGAGAGATAIVAATTATVNGLVTSSGTAVLDVVGLTGTGDFALAGGTLLASGDVDVSAGGASLNAAGAITVFDGATQTLTLAGANDTFGDVYVNSSTSLTTATGTLAVGGTLDVSVNLTLGAALDVTGNINLNAATLASASNDVALGGDLNAGGATITGAPALTLNGTTQTVTAGAASSDFGSLTVNATQVDLTSSNTLTFAGATALQQGTLSLGQDTTFNGVVTVEAGGLLTNGTIGAEYQFLGALAPLTIQTSGTFDFVNTAGQGTMDLTFTEGGPFRSRPTRSSARSARSATGPSPSATRPTTPPSGSWRSTPTPALRLPGVHHRLGRPGHRRSAAGDGVGQGRHHDRLADRQRVAGRQRHQLEHARQLEREPGPGHRRRGRVLQRPEPAPTCTDHGLSDGPPVADHHVRLLADDRHQPEPHAR